MTPEMLWIPRSQKDDPPFAIKSDALGWTVPFAEGIRIIRHWLATCKHEVKVGGYDHKVGAFGQLVSTPCVKTKTSEDCIHCLNLRDFYRDELAGLDARDEVTIAAPLTPPSQTPLVNDSPVCRTHRVLRELCGCR